MTEIITKVMLAATLFCGDCREAMKVIEAESIDSVVCDPPYELGFMGKKWDASGIAYDVGLWRECLRVLKPGGHLLAFGGSRTYHRLACAIEDAGFEIRDQIMWLYGSGFPKSHNLKSEWQGWGTALKPAHEPIVVARKPLIGTVAENVLEHGTGALNIDGCRVGNETIAQVRTAQRGWRKAEGRTDIPASADNSMTTTEGRWPANVIHDGSEEVLAGFPDAFSGSEKFGSEITSSSFWGNGKPQGKTSAFGSGNGSAARFFYCAKASKSDRGEGNTHPTVKPTELMRYLCRLVTPPGGVLLDPFMGSGSTGKAAVLEGFRFVGIEREAEYYAIAENRIENAHKQPRQEDLFGAPSA